MVSYVSVASLLMASALPGALAWGKPPKDLCDDKTYEIYRKDLPPRSDFYATATADAYGKNTFTYTDQYLFQVPGGNYYDALVTGSTDGGEVILFNEGSGSAVDCDLVKELDFVEIDGYDCVYEVDWRARQACTRALARFRGFAYIEGKGQATLTTEVVQSTGYSATSQSLNAAGTRGIIADLSQTDTVIDEKYNVNQATANLNVQTQGDSVVDASTFTEATTNSSHSSTTLDASTTSGGKKDKKDKKRGNRGL